MRAEQDHQHAAALADQAHRQTVAQTVQSVEGDAALAEQSHGQNLEATQQAADLVPEPESE
jgi:hypothetical protein